MPALSDSERDEFLSQPGILCRIATLKSDGSPHVTPAWFIYEDGRVFVTPRLHSSWRKHIARDPRVALTIDDQELPYRKVVLEGRAVTEYEPGRDDEWRDQYRRIAQRYVPPEAAEQYIQDTIDEPRALISLSLADATVRTWRMPLPGEDPKSIWHPRYYERA
jgi:PPOX class probable F420-dependent enzyme